MRSSNRLSLYLQTVLSQSLSLSLSLRLPLLLLLRWRRLSLMTGRRKP